jgi:hypothetical protein
VKKLEEAARRMQEAEERERMELEEIKRNPPKRSTSSSEAKIEK